MNALLRSLHDDREARAPRVTTPPSYRSKRRSDQEEDLQLKLALGASVGETVVLARNRRMHLQAEQAVAANQARIDARLREIEEQDRKANESTEQRRQEMVEARARTRAVQEANFRAERARTEPYKELDREFWQLAHAVSRRTGVSIPDDVCECTPGWRVDWHTSSHSQLIKETMLHFLRGRHDELGHSDEKLRRLLRRVGRAVKMSAADVHSVSATFVEQRHAMRRLPVHMAQWRAAVSLMQLRMRASRRLYAPGGAGYHEMAQHFEIMQNAAAAQS